MIESKSANGKLKMRVKRTTAFDLEKPKSNS